VFLELANNPGLCGDIPEIGAEIVRGKGIPPCPAMVCLRLPAALLTTCMRPTVLWAKQETAHHLATASCAAGGDRNGAAQITADGTNVGVAWLAQLPMHLDALERISSLAGRPPLVS
jgi:hypothetical protein